jgi:hypothetical protein
MAKKTIFLSLKIASFKKAFMKRRQRYLMESGDDNGKRWKLIWVIIPIIVILSVGVVTVGFTGCARKKQQDPMKVFGVELLQACKNKDMKALIKHSWTDIDQAMQIYEDLTKKKFNLDRKEMISATKKAIEIFLRSYDDLFDGVPATIVTAQHESAELHPNWKKLNPRSFILWVKKGNKYYGIKIDTIITTKDRIKVNDWIGHQGYPTQPGAILWKKRANLVRDSLESCDYPAHIEYAYEYHL